MPSNAFLIYLIVIDAVAVRTARAKPRGIIWDPIKPKLRLESLDYADGICSISHELSDMQGEANDLVQEAKKVRLHVNKDDNNKCRF